MPLELNVNMPDKEFLELLSKFSLYKTTSNTALVGPELLELSSADFMARALRFALIRSSEIETYFLVFHLLKWNVYFVKIGRKTNWVREHFFESHSNRSSSFVCFCWTNSLALSHRNGSWTFVTEKTSNHRQKKNSKIIKLFIMSEDFITRKLLFHKVRDWNCSWVGSCNICEICSILFKSMMLRKSLSQIKRCCSF